jgi:hypothetical protein
MPVATERVAMTQPAPVPTPPPGDPAPANPPAPAPALTPPAPVDPAASANPLLADLAKEREKRQRLESLLADSLGIDLKGGGGAESHVDQIAAKLSSHEERFASYEANLAAEREARWRAEVAAAKGLTPEQAARLRGGSPEEFAADADALLALFPAAGPRNPAPDPSQGARGGQPGPDLEARIAEARAKGDFRGAIALERQKLLTIQRPS